MPPEELPAGHSVILPRGQRSSLLPPGEEARRDPWRWLRGPGAGTRLSDSLADDVRVTLLDQNDSFHFGFSKLDVLFGRRATADVLLHYRDISKDGVEFRQERVTSIDPEERRVTTDEGSYDADVLAVALGADYDMDATPGFEEGGFEYYSVAGAERMRDVLPDFDSGTILIGILGHPFKCPPAPFEGALLLHDHLVERGIRAAAEIRVLGPMAAPVPITKELSQSILNALEERGSSTCPTSSCPNSTRAAERPDSQAAEACLRPLHRDPRPPCA